MRSHREDLLFRREQPVESCIFSDCVPHGNLVFILSEEATFLPFVAISPLRVLSIIQ